MPGQSRAALAAEILVVSVGLLEVAAAWTLVVEVGKHTRGQDIMSGRARRAELPGAGQRAGEEAGSRAPEISVRFGQQSGQ